LCLIKAFDGFRINTFIELNIRCTFISAILAYSNIWLSNWSTLISNEESAGNQNATTHDRYESTNTRYLTVYGILGAVQGIMFKL